MSYGLQLGSKLGFSFFYTMNDWLWLLLANPLTPPKSKNEAQTKTKSPGGMQDWFCGQIRLYHLPGDVPVF